MFCEFWFSPDRDDMTHEYTIRWMEGDPKSYCVSSRLKGSTLPFETRLYWKTKEEAYEFIEEDKKKKLAFTELCKESRRNARSEIVK